VRALHPSIMLASVRATLRYGSCRLLLIELGPGGLSKIFLHEILPVKQTLYVDTDAFFVADPALLWAALVVSL